MGITEEKYEQLYNKYKSIASTKTPFQISDNILTPTMGEMLEEDLSYEALLQISGENENPIDTAYYLDPPFTTTLGYDKDLDAMLVEAPVALEKWNEKNISWTWNKFDGDTLYYRVSEVNAGTGPINLSSGSFSDFKEYFNINAKAKNSDSSKFGVRFVGMNCPEIPHFEAMAISEAGLNNRLEIKTIGEIKNNSNYHYWKFPTSNKYDFEQTYTQRDDKEKALFLKTVSNGETTYNEVIRHKGADKNFEPAKNNKTLPSSYKQLKDNGYFLPADPELKVEEALLIVAVDESTKGGIADGYKAQKALKEKLEASKYETTMVLDLKTLTQSTEFEKLGFTLYSPFYLQEYAAMLANAMKQSKSDVVLSGYNYNAYGVDIYGRYLSAIYTKDKSGRWINLNKYVISQSKQTVVLPDYTGHPELANKNLTDAFNLWSYDFNRYLWLDSYEELTEKSYQKRMKLHEDLSGLKVCKMRSNTVLIGDTLMLIPPTNIRNITQTTYEKTPLLRSKGQITKGGNHNESILELTLYFAGDHGINGIPHKETLPSGEEVTYYMNGLRSLIAQFKLTPFLPIESEYINDVLNIEAVSLLNIQVTTVPDYPKMLQAVLTLREFNYRMFMPDLPLGIEDNTEAASNALSETNPIFAKAFQWDVFRYYYQRLLLAGETLDKLNYNSPEYNEYLYRGVTSLKPTSLCDSNISFYIPDIDWLDEALQRKKDKDEAIVDFKTIELSQDTRTYAKKLGEAIKILTPSILNAEDAFINGIGDTSILKDLYVHKQAKTYPAYSAYLGGRTRLDCRGVMNPINEFCKPIHDAIDRGFMRTGLFSSVMTKESSIKDSSSKDGETLVWTTQAKIANIDLSAAEKSALREFISINLDKDKKAILNDDCLEINVYINIDKEGNVLSTSYDSSLILDILNNLKKIGNNELTSADQNAIDDEDYNYRDPVKMPFVPLIENVLATEMSISLSNLFTETKLKAVDGVSGQYVGGQDSVINLKIITCDQLVVSTLGALPDISFQFTNDYKRIMSCTPIRIKSDFTQLYGINEVAIDMMDISTIDEMPGAYEITMRMSSVDRTVRQRETLRKMDFTTNGGFVGTGEAGKQSIKTFFDLEDCLSQVELYPDLEIPTLSELKARGYAFVKYALSQNRAYPDPDFYMVYANSYTAAIIKAQIKNFYDNLLNEDFDTEELESIILSDTETRESFIAKLDEVSGIHLIGQNKTADITSEQIKNIDNYLKKVEKNNKNDKNSKKHAKNTEKALKYLMASNVTDGWVLKPTWSAPLCDASTNDLIKQMPKAGTDNKRDEIDRQAAIKLKTTRRDLIREIDNILSKPMDLSNVSIDIKSFDREKQEEKIRTSIQLEIMSLFNKNEKLYNLLNPLADNYRIGNGKRYDCAGLKDWMMGFTYAAACVNSSEKDFNKTFMQIDKINGEWGPRMWFNEISTVHRDGKNVFIPLCRVGEGNVGLSISKSMSAKELENNMIKDALNRGHVFGPFGIRIYSVDELVDISTPELNIKYVDKEEYPLYKHTVKSGFLDPYYNALKEDSEELNRYKKGIMLNSRVAARAFLRNTLVWLRKMILDGLFISEIDILADDLLTIFTKNNSIFENGKLPTIDSEKDSTKEQIKDVITAMEDNIFKLLFMGISDSTSKIGDWVQDKLGIDKENDKESLSDLYLMYASMCDLLPKSFCARMIYPIFLAATDGNPLIYNEAKARNYEALDAAVNSSLSGNVDDILSRQICTFFSAMIGQGMIDHEDLEKSWTDLSQKVTNSISKEVYLEFSTDPKIYTMHSYYDMLMNDKRGRLVRAFPTYYMILIDEGRKIGYWKLHDNFYNMSSISDIQVVKSRKMPADTASVTMTNAYNSYATEHDNSTRYKYADLYGVKDVFDSIFSPKRYFEKADQIRKESVIKDKVVLKPGVRMHLRMGYSADAAKLPPMFNGRITDVNAGEVVDIVAQGDGIELTNPLNNLGNIESNQIDTAQSLFFPSVLTNFRGSFSKGGLSPKNLLASIMCAEYGGLEGIVNHVSNGQYFNTNPFGIAHFGDMRYTEIFSQGETAQNLYEVTDDDLLVDMNTLSKEPAKKATTPIINTSLYDKTFWDLMHISARAGKDYVSAVRDFGFRSTIFLGQHNHYYAYGYKKVNGNVYEKRKPFQQYHYIEPYNDIIYNTIKASESDIKTNATGLWQATNWTFGRKTQTVGPMYLDINIYPEYQKSMTYDTGMLADGNGGLDFNPITKLGEGHVFSGKRGQDDKTYDDKVNVKLVERMTVNALKDTVKDMYQGEVCILGYPGVKPFDRVHIFDHHEDMTGDFEVETVIHSLNAYTGFTTTIHPDLIVRHKENQQEIAARSIASKVNGTIMTVASVYAFKAGFSRINSVFLKNIMKSTPLSHLSGGAAKTLATSSLFLRNLEKLDSKTVKKITDAIGDVIDDVGGSFNNVYMKSINNMAKELLDLDISYTSSATDLIKYFKKIEDLNMNTVSKNIDSAIEAAKKRNPSDKSIKELEKLKNELVESYDEMIKELDMGDFFRRLSGNEELAKELNKIDKNMFEYFSKQGYKIKNQGDIKRFNKIFQSDKILKAVAGADEAIEVGFKTGIGSAIKFASKDAAKGGLKGISNVFTKGTGLLSGALKKVTTNPFAMNIVSMIISTVVTNIIGVSARSIFESWFDSLQTLTIYPMKQYGKNFTAGITGAKACTYGSPSADGWNSIQGMVIQAYETIANSNNVFVKYILGDLLHTFVADPNSFQSMANTYKANLGIIEDESLSEQEIVNNLYNTVSTNLDNYGNSKAAVSVRQRIQSLDKKNEEVRTSFNTYAIRNLKIDEIPNDIRISKLVGINYYPSVQAYIADGRLKLAHDNSKDSKNIDIVMNGKKVSINALPTQMKDKGKSWDYPDLPMLQKDASVVLKTILDETYKLDYLEDNKYVFHSGTIVNSNDWNSTGFSFILQASESKVTDAFDKAREALKSNYETFKYKKIMNGYYTIKVYPPIY